MAFNVGDKVYLYSDTSEVYTVEYGPFSNGGDEKYVLKNCLGSGVVHFDHAITLAPKFKAGDRIRIESLTDTYEIVYGPFNTIGGPNRYLCKNDGNIHRYVRGDVMTSVYEPKVGDRVRIVSAKYADAVVGSEGELISVSENFRTDRNDIHKYKVLLDDGNTLYVRELEKA